MKFPNGKHDDIIDAPSGAVRLSSANNKLNSKIYAPDYAGI